MSAKKPTIIYGLIDPLTNHLRYVGKTVKSEARRLSTHIWHARFSKRRRYVLAWVKGLLDHGCVPEIFTIETIPHGGEWVEAEQFWIAYFRSIGADLCNLTIGGEGALGAKVSAARRAQLRERWSGDANPNHGKPMRHHVREALHAASLRCRSDPEWVAWAAQRRAAGQTPDARARSIAGLKASIVDPTRQAARKQSQRRALEDDGLRARIGAASKAAWARDREKIIVAQNAGKGEAFIRKQSDIKKRLWSDPEWRKRNLASRKRKLTDDQVVEIRRRAAEGESNKVLAAEYGIDQSVVSHIKAGRRRAQSL